VILSVDVEPDLGIGSAVLRLQLLALFEIVLEALDLTLVDEVLDVDLLLGRLAVGAAEGELTAS